MNHKPSSRQKARDKPLLLFQKPGRAVNRAIVEPIFFYILEIFLFYIVIVHLFFILFIYSKYIALFNRWNLFPFLNIFVCFLFILFPLLFHLSFSILTFITTYFWCVTLIVTAIISEEFSLVWKDFLLYNICQNTGFLIIFPIQFSLLSSECDWEKNRITEQFC